MDKVGDEGTTEVDVPSTSVFEVDASVLYLLAGSAMVFLALGILYKKNMRFSSQDY